MNYDDYLLMRLTLDDLLNWLDRPDTASLELYPREVKACRCLLLNIKEELEVYKRAFERASEVYADMAGADVELFKRDMLEDAREQE